MKDLSHNINVRQIKYLLGYFTDNMFLTCMFVFFIILILVFEKDKIKKTFFGLYPLLSCVILINPTTLSIVKKIYSVSFLGTVMYYLRFFYCINFNITIAYGISLVCEKYRRVIVPLLFVVLIVLFGSTPVHNNLTNMIIEAENLGKVPKIVYDLEELIPKEEKNNYIRVVIPSEALSTIKIQNPNILYDNYSVTSLDSKAKIEDIFTLDKIDIEYVQAYCQKRHIDYLPVKNTAYNIDTLKSNGFEYVDSNDSIALFKCKNNRIEYNECGYIDKLEYQINGNLLDIRILRDKENKIVKETVLNSKEPLNYNEITIEYNEKDRTSAIKYSLNGKLCIINEGYSIKKYNYNDASGRLEYIEYLDNNLEVIDKNTGEAIEKYIYSSTGEKIETIFLDKRSNEVVTTRGYSRIKYEYDENDNLICEKYFKFDKLATDNRNVHKICSTYDDDNKIISKLYTDIDDNRIENGDYDQITYEYDKLQKIDVYMKNGKEIWREYNIPELEDINNIIKNIK